MMLAVRCCGAAGAKRLTRALMCRSRPYYFDIQSISRVHTVSLHNLHTTSTNESVSSTNQQPVAAINSDKFDAAIAWVLNHPHDVKLGDWQDVLNELLSRRRFEDFNRVWQSWYSVQSFDMSRCQPDPMKRSRILVSALKSSIPPITAVEVMTRLKQWGLGHSSAAHDLMIETYLATNDVKQAIYWFDDLTAKDLPRDDRSHKLEHELLNHPAINASTSHGVQK